MGNMMECLPSGGWFSLGLCPQENHPPSGKHSVMLPTLAWHICIMCVLPTIQSHVFVLFATDKNARSSCRRCAHFTIGTNEQNQHFAKLRQKRMFVHTRLVLDTRSSAPNICAKFGWKNRTFCHKKVAKVIAKLESDRL